MKQTSEDTGCATKNLSEDEMYDENSDAEVLDLKRTMQVIVKSNFFNLRFKFKYKGIYFPHSKIFGSKIRLFRQEYSIVYQKR